MSTESRYRLLLLAYPRGYRVARGEEMLDVLLATEERRGRRSAAPEAASLLAHGLALRVRAPLAWRAADHVGVAGVGLALLLAVLGLAQLGAMSLRGLGLDGYPDGWMTSQLWVDPRWPVALAWLATASALLLRLQHLAVALAWVAVLLDGWLMLQGLTMWLALPGLETWWIGNLGPGWEIWITRAQVSWWVLTLVAALLIGGPRRAARAVAVLPARRWLGVLACGLVGVAISGAAAPVAFHLGDGADMILAEDLRSPMIPAALAALALVAALLRTPYSRGALSLLSLTGLVPVLARWSEIPAALVAGGTLFVVGYLTGTRRSPGGATAAPAVVHQGSPGEVGG